MVQTIIYRKYSRHFSGKNHNFNTHVKFILIEQIRHVDIDTEKIKERLKQRENFWMLTLETLIPKGLNQELVQIIKLETKNIPREQPLGRN